VFVHEQLYTAGFARDLGEQMPYALQVIACQATSCRTEIVLPFLTAPREEYSDTSVKGDPYLHIACPRCSHVFRYTGALSRGRVSDTPNPYLRPASTVWFRVWLKCDGTACNSRIRVESAMTNGAIDEPVKTLVLRWVLDDAVKCGFGHHPFQPPEAMWAGIVCPGWTNLILDSPR
jgi:hypothetical protein